MDHLHRIEYHGWYTRKGEEWRRRYTLECACDFLARTEAKAGVYAITVWRKDIRVCTVGMEWSPTKG